MTNQELLEKKIKDSGKKISYLAKKCGLSYAGFRNCVIGKAEFKQSHIEILCKELDIKTTKERMAIFFAHKGE